MCSRLLADCPGCAALTRATWLPTAPDGARFFQGQARFAVVGRRALPAGERQVVWSGFLAVSLRFPRPAGYLCRGSLATHSFWAAEAGLARSALPGPLGLSGE